MLNLTAIKSTYNGKMTAYERIWIELYKLQMFWKIIHEKEKLGDKQSIFTDISTRRRHSTTIRTYHSTGKEKEIYNGRTRPSRYSL